MCYRLRFHPSGMFWQPRAGMGRRRCGRPRLAMLTVKGHAAPLTSVSFSPNGEFIATGSRDGTTRLWSFDNGKEIAKLASTGPVWQVAFSPDGAILGVRR